MFTNYVTQDIHYNQQLNETHMDRIKFGSNSRRLEVKTATNVPNVPRRNLNESEYNNENYRF